VFFGSWSGASNEPRTWMRLNRTDFIGDTVVTPSVLHQSEKCRTPAFMAHPIGVEPMTFAFGGQRWVDFWCLPEIAWNYRSP
jgi:hypothetical protein